MGLSRNGTTTWGQEWEWVFAGSVELKDSKTGKPVMVTYLHSRDPEMTFENEKYIPSFQPTKEQSHEWEDICWQCYQEEQAIYDQAASEVDDFASRWLHHWALNHPDWPNIERILKVREYDALLTDTLQAVKAALDLTDEDYDFALRNEGPLYKVINDWLNDLLESSNIRVSSAENAQTIAGITFEHDEIYTLKQHFLNEMNRQEASYALGEIESLLHSHISPLDRDVAYYILNHRQEFINYYAPRIPDYIYMKPYDGQTIKTTAHGDLSMTT